MTEDDTFKKLQGVTHEEMQYIWSNSDLYLRWDYYEDKLGIDEVRRQVVTFFNSHGWAVQNYSAGFR